MFVVTVEFIVKVEQVEDFERRVLQQARDSLNNEDECHIFDVCRDTKQPNRIFLYEIYSTEEAFMYHLASDHFKSFDKEVGEWVVNKTVQIFNRLS